MASAAVVERIHAVFSAGGPNAGAEPEPSVPADESSESSELVQAIDAEINQRQASCVPWRRLELCFKWLRVQEYLSRMGVRPGDDVHADVRRLLQGGGLGGLEYDAASARVTHLGVHGM